MDHLLLWLVKPYLQLRHLRVLCRSFGGNPPSWLRRELCSRCFMEKMQQAKQGKPFVRYGLCVVAECPLMRLLLLERQTWHPYCSRHRRLHCGAG